MKHKLDNNSSPWARKEGFTLIEIMLVVVIIGILASVAAVQFGGRVGQGQENAAKASLQNISLALSLHELDTGTFPSSLQGLITSSGANAWKGPYLDEQDVPPDPWGNGFKYTYPSSRGEQFYDLKSLGKDGVESDDDIVK